MISMIMMMSVSVMLLFYQCSQLIAKEEEPDHDARMHVSSCVRPQRNKQQQMYKYSVSMRCFHSISVHIQPTVNMEPDHDDDNDNAAISMFHHS
jgi:hypothetical protein